MNWIRNILVVLCVLLSAPFTPVSLADTSAVSASSQQTYTITVDHHLSLAQAIAAGRYDWVNGNITPERFPVKTGDREQLTVELVSFHDALSSEEVLAELTRRNLRPATIEELLAFSAAFPDEGRRYTIVALGSYARVGGVRSVAYLYEGVAKRGLDLYWWDDGWSGLYRFLAVRN